MKADFFRNFRRKTERKKSSGSRGSITVLVTLILVPMVVVNSFMVDLSRLKLYGNQAVMTADAYGEAILSSYDNIVKEMYGIFALSKEVEEDKGENDEGLTGHLKRHLGSSFTPNKNTILFSYFNDIQQQMHKYSGFMPYKDAKVALAHQRVEKSVLVSENSAAILATQIGDFMKFRIVQLFLNGENSLMDAYEFVKGMKANNNVINKKRDFDKSATELLDKMEGYYERLRLLHDYVPVGSFDSANFVGSSYTYTQATYGAICDVTNTTEYQDFKTVELNMNSMRSIAGQHDGENGCYDDGLLCDNCQLFYAYSDNKQAVREEFDKIMESFEHDIPRIAQNEVDGRLLSLDFEEYSDLADALSDWAEKVADEYENLKSKNEELKNALREDNVSEALKDEDNGIPKDVEPLDTLLSDYSETLYQDIADVYNGQINLDLNSQWQSEFEENKKILTDTIAELMHPTEEAPDLQHREFKQPTTSKFEDYTRKNTRLIGLYDQLYKIFEEEGSKEKEMQKKGKEAENKAKDIQNTLSNDAPAITPRNVPFSGMGDDAKVKGFNISDILDGGLPDMADLSQLGTELFLKFYVVEYGFGMFSNRVTNMERPDRDNGSVGDAVEDATDIADNVADAADDASVGDSGDSDEVETSLTGYHKCRSVNYMYGAELEYLYGGHTESIDNLNDVRNLILTICAVMNFIASYTVPPVNSAIHTAAAACVHPAVSLVVQAALRLGFTAVETGADWDLLKNRDTAIFYKDQIDDLSVVRAPVSKMDDLTGMIPGVQTSNNDECEYDGTDGKTRSGFELELDYEMYLTLMLLTGHTRMLTERVGNLISMNISGVRAGVGDSVESIMTDDNKTFDAHEAYTAVNATCSVQLDFAVIPPGMAAWLLGEEEFSRLKSYSDNIYTFTVTRGY